MLKYFYVVVLFVHPAVLYSQDNERAWRLQELIDQGDLVSIRQLVDEDRSIVNERVPDRWGESETTPLVSACARSLFDVAAYLLDAGADPNLTASDEVTPLLTACLRTDNLQLIKLLVRRGAFVNATNAYGETALFLSSGFADNLSYRRDVAVFLIASGADVNVVNANGETALIEACKGFITPEIVKVLLDAGGDVNYQSPDKKHGQMTALLTAIAFGRPRIVDYLLSQKANFAARDHSNTTALMFAAATNDETLKLILSKGHGDVNARNDDKMTAFLFACKQWQIPNLRLLVSVGADAGAREMNGKNGLHVSGGWNVAVDRYLIEELKFDPNSTDGDGNTTLMLVSTFPTDPDAISYLLSRHANVNAKNKSGETALSIALKSYRSRLTDSSILVDKLEVKQCERGIGLLRHAK